MGNADGAGGRLNAGGLECRHELLETLALRASEELRDRHLETVEGDVVFLHAAIAEHLDLAAGHTGRRERVRVRPARLLGEQHRQPFVAGLGRVGPHQQRHEIGAHRVRDPGLLAGDLVDVALPHGAGLERCEIRAGVRLREDGGRQNLAAGNAREVLLLLLFRAIGEDQLARDLGAGAERADTDIASRQLLGDHAHGLLTESKSAVGLRQRDPEDAELAEFPDRFQRDIDVGEVPRVCVRRHLGFGKAAHLLLDGGMGLIEPRIAGELSRRQIGHERGEPGLEPIARAVSDQIGRALLEAACLRGIDTHVSEASRLALAHRNAAGDLGRILGHAKREQALLQLAEAPGLPQPAPPPTKLAHRLHIGREPGKSVRGMLRAVETSRFGHLVPHGRLGRLQHALGCRYGVVSSGEVFSYERGRGDRLRCFRHRINPGLRDATSRRARSPRGNAQQNEMLLAQSDRERNSMRTSCVVTSALGRQV